MPNKFGRAVPVPDYQPHGLLPDGLIPKATPDGSFESQMSGVAAHVASTFNTMADDAATAEGTAAGKVAGLDPHYRPDGSLTLRGQAFNKAATQTYENNLDATLRTKLQATYEATKDASPVALKQAFDKLYADMSGREVFDQIRGDFNAQFARLRLPYENKALGQLEEDNHAKNRASLINSTTAIETNTAQMAAADPNNPDTAKSIQEEIARHAQLVDQQVERGDITADAGAKLKLNFRDKVLTSAALAQATALKTPEAVTAYRDNARAKFAAGGFNGLSADGYASLDAGLQALANTKRTEINTGVAQLSKNLDDYVDRAASGLPLPADEWTRYATSDAAKTPKGALALTEADAKVKVANVMRKMSVEDASRYVSGLRTSVSKDGATAPDAAVLTFAQGQIDKQRTALNTDQLGYAQQKGLVPAIAPIDFDGGDPAVLAAQFRDRAAQAKAIGGSLSRAPQFLRPDEVARMKEIVDKGGAPAMALAGAIVKGADNDAPAILRQISPDAPLLAQAGNILANGGSLSAARDAFTAAQIKAETGKDLPAVPPSVAGAAVRDTFGSAFALQGDDGSRIRTTADAIAKTRLYSGSVDPKSGDAQTIYTRALQEAAGAQYVGGVQYGGVASYKPGLWTAYKVPVPSGIRADSLRDVIRSMTDDDLKALPNPPRGQDGKPYAASEIMRGIPVWVHGGYRFAFGDPLSSDPQYVRGADGAPFVLPFSAVQAIAPRVTGALLGGS